MIIKSWEEAAERIKNNEVGVLPTDTIYGISCLANNRKKVEYIYELKKRNKDKPFVILIPSIESLNEFGVELSKKNIALIRSNEFWPGPFSIIFNVDKKLEYLHRGKETLAFRLPNEKNILNLIKRTGSIVSTSANISEEKNIESVQDAYKIFKDKLDFYLDAGRLIREPSRVIKIENGNIIYLR